MFCETFLNATDRAENYQLPGYDLHRFDYSKRTVGHSEHTGMCVYAKNSDNVLQCNSMVIRGVQFVTVAVRVPHGIIRILGVHRRPLATVYSEFLLAMNESLNSFDADIVVGDVNVNMGKEGKTFENAMKSSGYIRHPHLFTTKFYTEIDVVFAKRPLMSSTLETVFSVHLPLFIEID